MRIAVIFTGGTIGCSTKGSWLSIDNSTQYLLLKKFEHYKSEITFEPYSPYNILSENLSATELNVLQNEISNKISENFDGIIIAHGTDSLQYTAAAIEYSFCDCNIPIVFVSAQYPLDNEKSNGYSNFEAAVEFIRNKIANGVFVAYKNDRETTTNIHIASRILQHIENDSDIYSIDGTTYAKYDGSFTTNSITMSGTTNAIGVVRYTSDSQILTVQSIPGSTYSYSLDNIKAILLQPYHSGTLNTANAEFVKFCNLAYKKQIPIFVSSVRPGISYESSELFEKLNIIPLPYSTYISAYMKLWAGISLDRNLIEFMNKPIGNEIV